MCDLISRRVLIEYLKNVTVTEGITFETGFKQILTDIKNQPTVEPVCGKCIPLSEIYRVIAGHSDYHGDNILSALTCIAEGQEVKPIKPLEE